MRAVLLLSLGLVLTACGHAPASTVTTSEQPGSEKAAQAWASALASGDGKTGCGMATPELQQAIAAQMKGANPDGSDPTCEQAFKLLHDDYVGSWADVKLRSLERVSESGTHATYELAWTDMKPGDSIKVKLEQRKGKWLVLG